MQRTVVTAGSKARPHWIERKTSSGMPGERFPFEPFPTGWFKVASSHELVADRPLSIKAFGQDLVLFRSETGAATLLAAHCPHLGAHLGQGTVVDGQIVCPFHGWAFNAKGNCVHVPAAKIIPSRANLRAWHVQEVNQSIMVWHDAHDHSPLWELPVLAENDTARWTPIRPCKADKMVSTHVQEVAENGIDLAHFAAIHGKQVQHITRTSLHSDGPMLTHRIHHGFSEQMMRNVKMFSMISGSKSTVAATLEFNWFGLGMIVVRAKLTGHFPVEYTSIIYGLPVDDHTVRVTSDTTMQRKGALTGMMRAIADRETVKAIYDDMAIMETKIYQSRPQLSDADGPIMDFRKWAQQFYAGMMPVIATAS